MNYEILVTRQDIDLGVRDQSAHCIVATAIGRQIPEATRISVDAQSVRFTIGRKRLVFLTPPKVGEYVIAFDAGDFERIQPMGFKLSNPLVAATSRPRASRLIVKGEHAAEAGASHPPSRTRAFGQRAFRVNRPGLAK